MFLECDMNIQLTVSTQLFHRQMHNIKHIIAQTILACVELCKRLNEKQIFHCQKL